MKLPILIVRFLKWGALSLICFMVVDLCLALAGRRPWFSIPMALYKDGGSTQYVGLFYRILYKNQMFAIQEEDGSLSSKRIRGPQYSHSFLPIKFDRISEVEGR